VVAALTLLPGNRDASVTLWLKTLLLANIYVDDRLPDGLTQMWSLGTEVAFYLVLPALMWLALSRRRAWARSRSRLGLVVTLMLMVNVVWLMDLSVRLDVGGSMIRLWLPSYLTWFGVGLVIGAGEVLARSGGSGPGRRLAVLLREMGRSPGTCWTAALALFAIAATPVAGPADLTPQTLGAAMTKNLLYALVAGLLILPGVFAAPQGLFMRTLANATLRHVGHLSYGLFCIHLVVLELVADWREIELFRGRALELFCITLVVALAVSEALYRLVERPFMRWRNLRVGGSRSEATKAPKVNATNS
jgi:peptidoglycan/LPS O-acetylase OafA/YrhL